MLVLTRKVGERVLIGETVVTVLGVRRGKVRLGFVGPKSVRIKRDDYQGDGSEPHKNDQEGQGRD